MLLLSKYPPTVLILNFFAETYSPSCKHAVVSVFSGHAFNELLAIIKCVPTRHKKFSEGKQIHVGMETSKINQTRWVSFCCSQPRFSVLGLQGLCHR